MKGDLPQYDGGGIRYPKAFQTLCKRLIAASSTLALPRVHPPNILRIHRMNSRHSDKDRYRSRRVGLRGE
jgi:hypothetical protein